MKPAPGLPREPISSRSDTRIRLTGGIQTLPPPPLFVIPALRLGKWSVSSNPRNKPPKGSLSQLIYTYLSISIYNMYIFTIQCPLIIGPAGGSAGQPLLALGGKALNQPKPHPSDRIE